MTNEVSTTATNSIFLFEGAEKDTELQTITSILLSHLYPEDASNGKIEEKLYVTDESTRYSEQLNVLALIAEHKLNDAMMDLIGIDCEKLYNMFDWTKVSMSLMNHPEHQQIIARFKDKIHWHVLGFETVNPDTTTLEFLKENQDRVEWVSLSISLLENRSLAEWDAQYPGFKEFFFDKIRDNRIDPTTLLMFIEFELGELLAFIAEFHDNIILGCEYAFTEQAHLIIDTEGNISESGKMIYNLFSPNASKETVEALSCALEVDPAIVQKCRQLGMTVHPTSLACSVILAENAIKYFEDNIDMKAVAFFQPVSDDFIKSNYALSEVYLSESKKGSATLKEYKEAGKPCEQAYIDHPDLEKRWVYFDLKNEEDNTDISLYQFIDNYFTEKYRNNGTVIVPWSQFIRDAMSETEVEDGFINAILFLASAKFRIVNNLQALPETTVDYEF